MFFANDLALVVVAEHLEDMPLYESEIIHTNKSQIRMVKLDLADRKTEVALITSRKKNNTVNI